MQICKRFLNAFSDHLLLRRWNGCAKTMRFSQSNFIHPEEMLITKGGWSKVTRGQVSVFYPKKEEKLKFLYVSFQMFFRARFCPQTLLFILGITIIALAVVSCNFLQENPKMLSQPVGYKIEIRRSEPDLLPYENSNQSQVASFKSAQPAKVNVKNSIRDVKEALELSKRGNLLKNFSLDPFSCTPAGNSLWKSHIGTLYDSKKEELWLVCR